MHHLLLYDLADDYLERRGPLRAEHLRLAEEARGRGELTLAGAVADPADLAVLVFTGDTPEAATRFAEADPYVRNGLVTRWRVRPWNVVVGAAGKPAPLTLLRRALDQMAALIATTSQAQSALPTPCASWDVSHLVTHVLDDLDKFTVAARGDTPDWSAWSAAPPSDWSGAFDSGARELLRTWHGVEPGRVVATPAGEQPLLQRADQQIAELGVHAWDLSRAIRSPRPLDAEVAEAALEWSRARLRPEHRGDDASGKAFGPEVAVAPDTSAVEQMAAWFGRDPRWSPPG